MFKRCAVLAVLAAALMPVRADATTITFLGAAPTGGTIYYTGGAGPLEGAGITLDLVIGTQSPVNSNMPAFCIGCELNFVTGGFLAGNSTAYVFDGGGSFSITGGVDLTANGLLGDAGDIAAGTTLLSGSFVGNQFVLADGSPQFAGLQLSIGQAVVASALSAYYGEVVFGGETLLLATFSGFGDVPGAFRSTAIENVIVSTPEPSTVALLGLALGGVLRRRLRRA